MDSQEKVVLYRREESPGYIISIAAKTITNRLQQNFKIGNYDVTPEQWIILDELWRKDGCSQLELATATYHDQPSTSRLINNLVKRGLVFRSQDPNDKRSNQIFLTDKGRGLQETLVSLVLKTVAESIDGIDGKELETCLKVLKQMTGNLQT
ncbi:MarR family transcriptional regulator [Paenibacillus sp. RC67]|uniref:MarR family winged helix-turn-helix transcriptional regulator n=1 Tax=Paenibacillus sp. RC67 TaxID=3039392 RepID=UPI0024ACDCBC|nr:MarR family transcriptional regulator [Paenibacillus sp. RC67]